MKLLVVTLLKLLLLPLMGDGKECEEEDEEDEGADMLAPVVVIIFSHFNCGLLLLFG